MNPDDKDGALLQQLKSVKLVWVDGYEGGTLVRWDNIGPTLMALILKVAPKLEPFQIGDA